ncbi:MAG: response regulator [Patescibacteria group bacterium]|jgi:DNA-binding response OmpR family regulator
MNNDIDRKNISIYEDDKTIREMYEIKLKSSGYGVYAHEDAGNVVQEVKHEKPDLVLMDILMPKVDGHAAIKALKDEKITAAVPILVITNFGDDVTVQKALWFGAYDVIVKADYTPQQVVDRVKDALAGKRASHVINQDLVKFFHIDEQARK